MKQRIIICGYPKSGNTWLTRLTAEILRCPVAGYWCEPFNKEVSIEGLDRESVFQCFKAHHTYEQITQTLEVYGNGTEKIIYIYRDPRSVVVSGSYFFTFAPKYPYLLNLLSHLPRGDGAYYRFVHSHFHKIDIMTKYLLEGAPHRGWLKEPWRNHIMGYRNNRNILMVSYEDLRAEPLETCRRISRFLVANRSNEELEDAVQAQSFDKKKKQFQTEGKLDKANFLRRGKSDSWRYELPLKNLQYIEQKIGDLMQELGYELSQKD